MRPLGREFSEDLKFLNSSTVMSILSSCDNTLVPMPWFTDQTCCDIPYSTSIRRSKFNLLIKFRLFPKEAQNLSA